MTGIQNGPWGTDAALADAIRNLPRDLPEEGLAPEILRTLAALPLPRRPLWKRLALFLDRPAATLTYRLATLVLLVGIFAGVWSLVAVRREAPLPGTPSPNITGLASAGGPPEANTPAATPSLASKGGSPEAGASAAVTFLFYAPQARSVAVVGSFNDWDPDRYPMVRDAEGTWKVRVDLSPGQYEYQFVVDGSTFVPDPRAIEQRDDGMGGANAVLRL